MWRWSYTGLGLGGSIGVFSTYVEMIPVATELIVKYPGILHVCGDDPSDITDLKDPN